MARVIRIETDKCTGCGTCALVCSLRNTGEYNPARSRIHVVSLEPELDFVPSVCSQCAKPACAAACPTGAITRAPESGIVSVNAEQCTGCRACEDACPFGQIVYMDAEGKAVKCEMCGGDPECVKSCPTGALALRDTFAIAEDKRKQIAEQLREIYLSQREIPKS